MGLSAQQQDHVREIITDYTAEYVVTYTRGAKEYGSLMSDLPALQMIKEAKQEAQDNYAYNHVAESQLEKVRTRLTALKELLEEKHLDQHDWLFNADVSMKLNSRPRMFRASEPVGLLDDIYDPIRRIEAIERILFG